MATATRRELLAGMGSLISIDFERDNGGIVLSMAENSMRISAAYPLVVQSKLRFTLHLSPEKKVTGTGIVRSVSSSGRSADMEILEIDAASRAEFDLWMGVSTAETASPEIANSGELPTTPALTAALPQTPILEIEQTALVLDSSPQEIAAESAMVVLPAEDHAVEAPQQPLLETSCLTLEPPDSAAPGQAPSLVSAPEVPLAPVTPSCQTAEVPAEEPLIPPPSFASTKPAPATLRWDAGAFMFPVLLDSVTDAAANHIVATPVSCANADPAVSRKSSQAEPIAEPSRNSLRASVPENRIERKVPFAAAVPARPAAEPEPGEENQFSFSSPEPAPEPSAIEEPRMAGALYLPNYNVEGITACGTDWHWKVRLYSLPLLSLQVAAERFEEFGWSLERDWHIWLALALIAAGFLPLVTKPTFVPGSLVLWLIGGRVAIRRRQPERAGERS